MKNRVQLIGHVGNDPKSKLWRGKTVANLTIATNDSYKTTKEKKVEQTEWHKVVAWGKLPKS
jgi:single-strand DNA-binding protein